MAKVHGYRCDVCDRVEQSDATNDLPDGWMKVHVSNHHDRANGVGKDICSNKCLRDWANERMKADKPEKASSRTKPGDKGNFSPTQKAFIGAWMRIHHSLEGKVVGPHYANHARFSHDTNPDTNCLICQAMSEPDYPVEV